MNLFYLMLVLASSASAQTIYSTNSLGQKEYNKPHLEYDARLKRYVTVDPLLGKQYHKPQYTINNGKIQQTDSIGNPVYGKSGFFSPK